jgi:hypothetical protein
LLALRGRLACGQWLAGTRRGVFVNCTTVVSCTLRVSIASRIVVTWTPVAAALCPTTAKLPL